MRTPREARLTHVALRARRGILAALLAGNRDPITVNVAKEVPLTGGSTFAPDIPACSTERHVKGCLKFEPDFVTNEKLATKAERVRYQANAKTTLCDDGWELRHTSGQ